MSYDFSKLQKVSKPRNEAWSNWAKFEKVGDKVEGYIRDVFYRPAEGEFKEARCFTIEQADGVLINVPTKRLPFIMSETDDLALGDVVRFELTELKKSETKGFSPTKIITTYSDPERVKTDGKTVKQLEIEDMGMGIATPVSEADKKFDAIPTTEDVPFKPGEQA